MQEMQPATEIGTQRFVIVGFTFPSIKPLVEETPLDHTKQRPTGIATPVTDEI